MRTIISTSTIPYYNLAIEEFFLKNSSEEIFLVYINEPCIIVGKHQNLLSEINLEFVTENKIKLARRISGGGTVYQDNNNLNFSFIHNCANLEQINFKEFTYPVLEALKEMGLDVEFSGRNDLLINQKKISGNAMHIFKTRVLSHGTLLFNTDLKKLSEALRNIPQKYIDKSIKSVKSKVTNISDYLSSPKSINNFSQTLVQNIIGKTEKSIIKPISEVEDNQISKISKEKFETWDWIYGYSPQYLFQNSFLLSERMVAIELHVEKGIIRRVKTNINNTEAAVYQYAIDLLLNVKHDYNLIIEHFTADNIIASNPAFNIREFCQNLF